MRGYTRGYPRLHMRVTAMAAVAAETGSRQQAAGSRVEAARQGEEAARQGEEVARRGGVARRGEAMRR